MEKDINKTDVVFRVIKIGGISEVTALFPHQVGTREGLIDCYAHLGQHGSADYGYCVSKGRLATEEEYKDLKAELENGFGYNFNLIKKQNRTKYLKSYYEVRKS